MHLRTERLLIREFTLDDFDALKLLLGDPQAMAFSMKGPLGEAEALEYLQNRILGHYEKHGCGWWALILPDEQRLIGLAGLCYLEIEGEGLVEVGYRLLADYWGQGYVTEACRAICRYAFEEMGLDRVIAMIDKRNAPSMAVARRLGMHRWKETVFHGFDVWLFALDKTDSCAL